MTPSDNADPSTGGAGRLAVLARSGDAISPLAVAVASFAAIVALVFLVEDPLVVPSIFLIVPIAIVTRSKGVGAGVAAAVVAMSAVVVRWHLDAADPGLAGYLTRALAFFSVPPLIVWAARDEAPPDSADDEVRPDVAPAGLSRREIEVLNLLALGHTNGEIAERLHLSVRTVESHRARLQRKLRIAGRSELVRFALEHGLLGGARVPGQP